MRSRQKTSLHRELENFTLFIIPIRKVLKEKEERNTLNRINIRKANWIVQILGMTCFLKRVIKGKAEGRIEVKGRRGRRSKHILGELKEKEKIL
jgi:hypothetical protein